MLESLDIWTHVFPFAHAFQRYMTALGTPTYTNTKDKNHMWQSDKVKNLSKEVLNLGHHCLHSSVTLEKRVYVEVGMTQEDLT